MQLILHRRPQLCQSNISLCSLFQAGTVLTLSSQDWFIAYCLTTDHWWCWVLNYNHIHSWPGQRAGTWYGLGRKTVFKVCSISWPLVWFGWVLLLGCFFGDMSSMDIHTNYLNQKHPTSWVHIPDTSASRTSHRFLMLNLLCDMIRVNISYSITPQITNHYVLCYVQSTSTFITVHQQSEMGKDECSGRAACGNFPQTNT